LRPVVQDEHQPGCPRLHGTATEQRRRRRDGSLVLQFGEQRHADQRTLLHN
jgi:hypothetical protein